jgi:Na+/H+ antiporter NhaD/arsenite permease-like protein
MLIIGVLGLLSVPVFKYFTHLPPWVGMMIVASIVLILNEVLNRKAKSEEYHITHNHLLEKIEWNAILFFLGILSAVAVFQTVKVGELSMLGYSAEYLVSIFSLNILGTLIGVFSAVIDNVPLVAASIGMFTFPMDHWFWHFIAYTAGTGGSILIIGSAAGVVAMSMLKIDFMWYTKRFSFLILISYLCGVGAFFLNQLFI